MKRTTLVGIALVIIGAIWLAYQGISYTSREKILEIGPVQATKKTEKTIPLPPVIGGAILGAGLLLVIVGLKKR